MFAVVAVNTPVHGGGTAFRQTPQTGVGPAFPGPVFHYRIPSEFEDQVQPGVLAEVPFGSRQAQGIVIALSDAAPVRETKLVTRLLYGEPVLSGFQLDLGMWLSEHYFSPLIQCLRLMLPPGLLRQPQTVLRLHPQVPIPTELPPTQRQVVELLQQRGALSPAQIARRLGQNTAQNAIRSLLRRGVLVRSSQLPPPRARPKRVNFARLSASPPQIAGARPSLGRPSKQAQVLEVLLHEPDPLPSVSHILSLADATPSTLATMSRKGWIDLVPKRSLVMTTSAAQRADLRRAPKQQAVLQCLQARNIPVEELALRRETGASAAVLQALLKRGLIQRVVEPPAVVFRLDEQQARTKVIELRKATGQHRVLDYLLSRPPGEWLWVSWVYAETAATLADLRALEAHRLIDLAEREVWRDPLAEQSFALETPPRLTPDQQRVWAAVESHISHPHSPEPAGGAHPVVAPDGPAAFLLHGVTGSGKTEIYMRAAEVTLRRGRQVVILVPEISLTPQTVHRFAARFPQGLGVIHSALSDGERYDTWRRIRVGLVRLVIGPRSALFGPYDNLGLIVLDEEHDASYKQSDQMPAYHARDVAFRLATAHGATVLLGSATPDLATYHAARETDAIHLLELPQRILSHRHRVEEHQAQLGSSQLLYRPIHPDYEDVFAIDLPPVRIVDMRHELRAGNRSIFSRLLQREVERALAQGAQIILFLNRRGASTFVLCRDCGTVLRCPRCDVPLTYHLKGERLTCHHCNHQQAVPRVCPTCHSHRIKFFGVGTQRVERAVHEWLPDARVLRWDRDTTSKKGSHEALLDRFTHHQADVLIGTQMIAKGLDLPLVTVVGVISADTALNLPDFRAAERTFQLLAQVAGRAGRGPRGGQVIVQTYSPEHYSIRSAAQHDYASFYRQEIASRHQLGYPPFSRLARLVRSDHDLARCRRDAQSLAASLHKTMRSNHLDTLSLIGPAPCFLNRVRGRWRWQIIVRAPVPGDTLHDLFSRLPIPPGWRLNIDPLDIL